jgi:hypothetical protein
MAKKSHVNQKIPAFDPVDVSKLGICVCSICVTSFGCIQKNVQNPSRKSLENPILTAGMSLDNCPNDDPVPSFLLPWCMGAHRQTQQKGRY